MSNRERGFDYRDVQGPSSSRKRRFHQVSDSDQDEFESEAESSFYDQPEDPSQFLTNFGGYASEEDDEDEDQGNDPRFSD